MSVLYRKSLMLTIKNRYSCYNCSILLSCTPYTWMFRFLLSLEFWVTHSFSYIMFKLRGNISRVYFSVRRWSSCIWASRLLERTIRSHWLSNTILISIFFFSVTISIIYYIVFSFSSVLLLYSWLSSSPSLMQNRFFTSFPPWSLIVIIHIVYIRELFFSFYPSPSFCLFRTWTIRLER